MVAAELGRKAYQSQIVFPNGKTFIRAIVDGTVDPALVYTVYFTDKIARYWRQP